ncbi:MAG: ATP-dependent helicase [Clostridiaceae bacterium]
MRGQLNEAQRKAVESVSEVILCLAGAGTGKTSTLTSRISHLHDQRISCSNMIALTFTRLAGKEMKERVINMVGAAEGEKLFCNTFHAFCVKVIKEYGYLIGYDKEFTIYDQEDKENIIDSIIKEMKYKAHPDEVAEYLNNNFDAKAKNFFDVKSTGEEYKHRLKRNNAIDLDGLLSSTLELLRRFPQVQQFYNLQYEYLFVDEFQDTNEIQMNIIKAFNPKNLFVVGDDFQSIYGWRQARPEYILNFQKYYPDCEIIKLEENYRSTSQIIEAANKLISNNVNQTKKILKGHKEGPEIEYFEAETITNEVNIIISKILEKNEIHSDFAILTRTNKQLDPFIESFRRFNVPYQVVTNKDDPLKKRDVRMILNILEVILNNKDDMTLKKIINFPDIRINDLKMSEMEKIQIDKGSTLYETLKNTPEVKGFIDFLDDVEAKVFEEYYNAEAAFTLIAKELQLEERYLKAGRTSKSEDITQAAEVISRWEERQRKLGESTEFSAFLKWMHIRDIQEKLIEKNDAVKLMTVHASKGLEFKNVFVVGMNKNIFPSKRGDLEEERRLLYVAVTRAKERLYISRAKKVLGWGNKEMETEESQFIVELGNLNRGDSYE